MMGAMHISSCYPKFNGSHFWLATQLYPKNDRVGWQLCVNHDVYAQTPFAIVLHLRVDPLTIGHDHDHIRKHACCV